MTHCTLFEKQIKCTTESGAPTQLAIIKLLTLGAQFARIDS